MHQSALSFKPAPKPSTAPQFTSEPESDCINLVDDSFGDGNVAAHTISEHGDDSGEDDESPEFELVEAWIVRQEVPVTGGRALLL
jgi:hypothetical protein